jgi:integrase
MGRKRAVARQKGGGLVMLYLSDRLIEALRVYLGDRRCGPLFSGRAGGRLTVPGARHMILRLARRAGVAGRVNPHSWRHAFARRCVRSGLDLSRTARLLGHKSVTVTAGTTLYGMGMSWRRLMPASPGCRHDLDRLLGTTTDCALRAHARFARVARLAVLAPTLSGRRAGGG